MECPAKMRRRLAAASSIVIYTWLLDIWESNNTNIREANKRHEMAAFEAAFAPG